MGAIALGPTGNAQGDYRFMSLYSGAKISRHQWTALPMTDTAIARVHALGIEDEQPLIQERGLIVEWRPDHPIDESEYDRTYALPRNAPADPFNFDDFDPVDADEAADLLADAAAHDFVIEPADDPVALSQGADENVNPLHPDDHPDDPLLFDNEQPAIVDDYDDDSNTDNEELEEVLHADNDSVDNAADKGTHDAEAHDDDPTETNDDEGTHDDVARDDDPTETNDEHEVNNDDGNDDTRPYNLRHRGPPTARFNEAMDNPHERRQVLLPADAVNTTHTTNTRHYSASARFHHDANDCKGRY